MKKRVITLLLCLVLAVLSILRGFAASAEGIAPATIADFDVPCAAAILIDEDSGTVLAGAAQPVSSMQTIPPAQAHRAALRLLPNRQVLPVLFRKSRMRPYALYLKISSLTFRKKCLNFCLLPFFRKVIRMFLLYLGEG